MKIFIYHEILISKAISDFTLRIVHKHKLYQQYEYFIDILQRLNVLQVEDPNDADFFFVPLFLPSFQFENYDPERNEIISKYCKFINRGRHLLVGTGDFGQRSQSQTEMQGHPTRAYRDKYAWLDDRFSIIALESRADLLKTDIAFFPYSSELDIDANELVERSILCAFKGKLTYPELPRSHVRGGLLADASEMLNSEGFNIYDSDDQSELGGLTSRDLMRRAVFTLTPAGYGQWTFRLIEALLLGSIPILVADDYVLPFPENIDWEKYILRIATKDLLQLPNILSKLSTEKIVEMQRIIKRDRALFTKENCLQLIEAKLSEQSRPGTVQWALPRMRSMTEMSIICIDITNKCDLACSNCTRLLENQDTFWEMTLDNFRRACRSLQDFPGIIAVIGGNPCMHSKFSEISNIFEEEIKDRGRRGIWTNNAFKHTELLKEKYGAFNLNPHGVKRGIDSVQPIYQRMVKELGFNGGYYDDASEHAPLLVACSDVFGPVEMWEKIANCDINKNWSAAIVQNKGSLRAYFCEVAASFDLARNQDNGLPVIDGWWRSHMTRFQEQISRFCPGCGAPARLKGVFDYEEVDGYSASNADLAQKSVELRNRKTILIIPSDVKDSGHKVTKYQKNAQ